MRRLIVCLAIMILVISIVGEAVAGHITGSVMSREGETVAEGTVLFFSDALGPAPYKDKYMRTPEIITHTDRQGNFRAELPEGKYYVGAMKSLSGKWGGPPREGDMFFIVKDADNSPRIYEVHKDKSLDIGSMTEPEPVDVVSGIVELTAVEGIVLDKLGNPLEDVVVFAYAGPIVEQGLAFVSGYTEADGQYKLKVPEGGNYYLMVMGKFGSVFQGTGMTISDDGRDVSGNITVTTGEINSNVDIIITNQ